MREVIAIICADLHLQARPPVARAAEPDWWAAMARPLAELSALQQRHGCPVLVAGDIFDRWNAPPEVTNFALDHLPAACYAVPGQHDLPHHAYADIRRSAYWTLAATGKITNIEPGSLLAVAPGLVVGGFGWGTPLRPLSRGEGLDVVTVALIHRYVWRRGCGYVGAPDSAKVAAYVGDLAGWDVAAFGDNHKGFHVDRVRGVPGCELVVLNCGGFMRRKIDEREYQPHIGLLYSDGSVLRHPLDCTADVFSGPTATATATAGTPDTAEFLAGLRALGHEGLDYRAAVLRHMEANCTPPAIREIVLHAMERTR